MGSIQHQSSFLTLFSLQNSDFIQPLLLQTVIWSYHFSGLTTLLKLLSKGQWRTTCQLSHFSVSNFHLHPYSLPLPSTLATNTDLNTTGLGLAKREFTAPWEMVKCSQGWELLYNTNSSHNSLLLDTLGCHDVAPGGTPFSYWSSSPS